MATAKLMKKLDGWTGDARLYCLDPPLDSEIFVIVSATYSMDGPETYVFPAKEDGNVASWGEMDCSKRGNFSHEEILSGAGYLIG